MTTQTRLNAVLQRQKRGLMIDSLLAAALVIAIGVAVIALWLGLPSFAPAYATQPEAAPTASPAAATATMLEQAETATTTPRQRPECDVVQTSC
jgi:hypothetical protein